MNQFFEGLLITAAIAAVIYLTIILVCLDQAKNFME